MSYLSGIYLKSWFSWLGGGVQKTLRKIRKQAKEKRWKLKRKKYKEYKENIYKGSIFVFTFYIKNYILLENTVWEKVVFYVL